MIRKTVKRFTRFGIHTEIIEREIYFFVWFLPIYIKDTILYTNM